MLHSSKTTFTKSYKLFLFIFDLCFFMKTSLGKKKQEIGKCFILSSYSWYLYFFLSFFTRPSLVWSNSTKRPPARQNPQSRKSGPRSESRVPTDRVCGWLAGWVVSVATAQKVRDAGHARTPRAQAPGSSNASVRLGSARFTSARGEGTKQGTPMSRDENQFSTPVRNSRVVVIGTRTLELLDRCCWSLSYYVRRLCFCKLGNLLVVCNFVGDGRQWSRNLRAHDTTRHGKK